MKAATIGVLDFGGQYAHLIANRLRRLGVFSEVFPSDTSADKLAHLRGLILSGGPNSVYEDDAPKADKSILDLTIPILGICYGHQLLCHMMGGKIERGKVKEYGAAALHPLATCSLFKGLQSATRVWMSHGDEVVKLPAGFVPVGYTNDCIHAAVADEKTKRFGLQFHPEVTHSTEGQKILDNFIELCACPREWNMEAYLADLQKKVREQCAGKKVFLLVSGGVDSTVAFALLNKALGPEKVKGLHIDNGLMRKNESQAILEFLSKEGFHNLDFCDASETFLSALKNVAEPEKKRRIIGDTFFTVLEDELKRQNLDPTEWIWAQGTTYPDTIESGGTKNAATIKTHHNRVPKAMELLKQGAIIEPLAELYKDEVRELGTRLGIPDDLVWRHPFPGPGLGVRFLCQHQPTPVPTSLNTSDIESLCKSHQLTMYIPPIKSVGVQGDGRTYAHPLCLIGTAKWDVLQEISTTITNRHPELNRVVWEVASDGNAYTSRAQTLNRPDLALLCEADAVFNAALIEYRLMQDIWQMPVVLLPLAKNGKPVVLVRPIHSSEAMTASCAKLPDALLTDVWNKLQALGFGALWYDLTHKPPGTIEWE